MNEKPGLSIVCEFWFGIVIKSNNIDSSQVYVHLKIHKFLTQYLPLLDHGAHLVAGQVHAVEVGETVLALNIFGDELELTEGHLVVLQISEAHLEHTSLQTVRGNSWFVMNNMYKLENQHLQN